MTPRDTDITGTILYAVARVYDITVHELLNTPHRTQTLCDARYIAYQLLRSRTRLTLQEIGEMFHRDHSTVVCGLRKLSDLLMYDVPMQVAYGRVMNIFFSLRSTAVDDKPTAFDETEGYPV